MADQRLTDEQLRFFDTFGFLAFPGLLDDVITEIIDAFEEVWAQRGGGHNAAAHDDERRSCIVPFIDQHPRLCALLDDGRIHGMLCSLLGEDFNYTGSDGNYYAGDTQWHSDGFGRGGSQRFVKIAFYLDDLTRDTGCLRVIPGSHRAGEPFADTVQEHIRKIPDTWGVEGAGLPAVALTPPSAAQVDVGCSPSTVVNDIARRICPGSGTTSPPTLASGATDFTARR